MITLETIDKNKRKYLNKYFCVRDFFNGVFSKDGWHYFYSQKSGEAIDTKFVKRFLKDRTGKFSYWSKKFTSGYDFLINLTEKDEIRLAKYKRKIESKRLKRAQKEIEKEKKRLCKLENL